MKNNDAKILAEKYEKQILSEMPFRPKPGMDDLTADEVSGETSEKLPKDLQALGPNYGKATRNFHELPDDKKANAIAQIVTGVAKEVASAMAAGGGHVSDSRAEFQQRIADIINDTFAGKFMKSHTIHIARNVVKALEDVGALEEFDKAPKQSKSGDKPKASAADLW